MGNYDMRFTGHFWSKILKLLGSNLNFSMSLHPRPRSDCEGESTPRVIVTAIGQLYTTRLPYRHKIRNLELFSL